MTPVSCAAAPRQLGCRCAATDRRERRLQRVDMADALGIFELRLRCHSRGRARGSSRCFRSRSACRSTAIGVPSSAGQWSWNRSMRSTPSRFSDASASAPDAGRGRRRGGGRRLAAGLRPDQPALRRRRRGGVRAAWPSAWRTISSLCAEAIGGSGVDPVHAQRAIARRMAAIDWASSSQRPARGPLRPARRPSAEAHAGDTPCRCGRIGQAVGRRGRVHCPSFRLRLWHSADDAWWGCPSLLLVRYVLLPRCQRSLKEGRGHAPANGTACPIRPHRRDHPRGLRRFGGGRGRSGPGGGWGAQDDAQWILFAAIRRAIALGVNWIDTAAAYGLGHSEEIVRRGARTACRANGPPLRLHQDPELAWDGDGARDADLHRVAAPDSIRREGQCGR